MPTVQRRLALESLNIKALRLKLLWSSAENTHCVTTSGRKPCVLPKVATVVRRCSPPETPRRLSVKGAVLFRVPADADCTSRCDSVICLCSE